MRENGLVAQRDSVEVLLVEDDPADALMTKEDARQFLRHQTTRFR